MFILVGVPFYATTKGDRFIFERLLMLNGKYTLKKSQTLLTPGLFHSLS